jgi:hypothetical protein
MRDMDNVITNEIRGNMVESIFTKEALENMFSGAKSILYTFLRISTKYQIDFTIKITSDGRLSFESRENGKDKTYLKTISQSKNTITYSESEINTK